MIYTLTCNPSLDYMTNVPDFQLGKTNRTISESIRAGGKGINVSVMLKNLGHDSTCLGFLAGFTGKEIAKQVEEMGLCGDFIEIPQGMSRVNVKLSSTNSIKSQNLCETEINGMGPKIDEASLGKLKNTIKKIKDKDILILSGSVPKSLADTLYQNIMKQLSEKDVKILVDATGQLLLHTLPLAPFLVKPNKQELEDLFQEPIHNMEELIYYAKKIQSAGAKNVLVSLGGDGAFLLTENGKRYCAKAPKGELVNAVGAGDSMVAGFLSGYLEKGNYEFAFQMGVAAGSASAFSKGFANRQAVEALMPQVQIQGV